MADDVQITVGVALDQLNSSIESAKSQFDSLKSSIAAIATAGGFAVLIDQLTDFATQVQSAATILGVSTTEMQELGLMAKVSGGSMQEITTALQRMTTMAQRGELATSAQGAALKALGINAQQFASSSVNQQMALLADATKRLHDEGINAAPALSLISRGLAQMEPELQKGSAGIKAFQQSMVDAGAVMTPQVIDKLDEMGAQTTVTVAALKNLAAEFIVASPSGEFMRAIGEAVGALAKLMAAGQLSAYFMAALQTAMSHLENSIHSTAESLAEEADNQARTEGILHGAVVAYQALLAVRERDTQSIKVNLAAQEQQRAAIEEAKSAFTTEVEVLKQLQETHQITMQQMVEEEKAAAADRAAAEEKAGEDIEKITNEYNQEIAKINLQYSKSVTQEWTEAANMVSSAFNSQLRGLLAGTTTLTQAMKSMLGDLIISIIEGFVKMGVQWVATQAMMAVAGKSTQGLAAADFVSKIQADAALTFGGVFANLAPLMGPAAAGPAATSEALVQAQMAAVPAFAIGTPFVPQDMLAMVHQGEAIIPAGSNPFGGGGNTFGGNNVSLNISAIDGRSVANMLMSNKNVLNTVLSQIMRTNPGYMASMAQAGA